MTLRCRWCSYVFPNDAMLIAHEATAHKPAPLDASLREDRIRRAVEEASLS